LVFRKQKELVVKPFIVGQEVAVFVKAWLEEERLVLVAPITRTTHACVEVDGCLYRKKDGRSYERSYSRTIRHLADVDPAVLKRYQLESDFEAQKVWVSGRLTKVVAGSLDNETLERATALCKEIQELLKAKV
jgi:hypothetical protein